MKLNPYLNFLGNTEEAFKFYKSVFGGDFLMLQRFRDVEDLPDKEKMTESDLDKIMHVSLKIGEDVLMGTDALESQGHTLTVGNNMSLSIGVDSKEKAEEIFFALQEGGTVIMPLQKTFWGAYFGMVDDKFGVKWMISYDYSS